MKTFVSFDDQDTALEFNRILRNLERYQVVREITGGTRKSNSKYIIGYNIGRWGARNHVVNLLHSGNGAVRVTIGRIDRCWPVIVLSTVSSTDSFVQGAQLREAMRAMAYWVHLKGHTLRGRDLEARLESLAEVENIGETNPATYGTLHDKAQLKLSLREAERNVRERGSRD